MLLNQDSPKSESDIFIVKAISELSNKLSAPDERGIEIDSVESLYEYGMSVVQSNLHYMVSYFDEPSENQLAPDVCVRHGDLLTKTKVAVKRVMEEAATRKFIYFNNATVNGLCVAIENCLLDGLQRRLISLFEESHSLALLKKVVKDCEAANFVLNKVNNYSDHSAPYSAINNVRFFQESDIAPKSPNSMSLPNAISGLFTKSKQSTTKYLWIKLAMVDKKLFPIMEHIIQHHQLYYDDNSIMSTCLSGSLFLQLIAGPCSLDFSLVKPSEHIWNDPDATELMNRHKMHSLNSWPTVEGQNIYRSTKNMIKNTKNRPYLKIQNHQSPLQMHDSKFNQALTTIFNMNSTQGANSTGGANSVAKEYVESLHQNVKHVLLYGKNNVVVQPKENLDEMQGYLSLHLVHSDRLRLNWTPNQLMNGQVSEESDLIANGTSDGPFTSLKPIPACDSPQASYNKTLHWDSALSIRMENIVYLHCHNNEEHGGKVTLVCQDGVQYPPINFPPGGHLLQFLSCLETGLIPNGRLDPPLSHSNDVASEKTFPKRNRKYSNDSSTASDHSVQSKSKMSFLDNFNKSITKSKDLLIEEDTICSSEDSDIVNISNCDLVFKIIYTNVNTSQNSSSDSNHGVASSACELTRDDKVNFGWNGDESLDHTPSENDSSSSISHLCLVMRQQILSRAFCGWLQYVRNIKTVKTKFANLVEPGSIQSDIPCDASEGLTSSIWNDYKMNKTMDEHEIYRLIYFGGTVPTIRSEVWPRMLGHYSWSSCNTSTVDSKTELDYERSLSQWKALEVIIKQRDNENVVGHIESNEDTRTSKLKLMRQSDVDHKSVEENESRPMSNNIHVSNCDFIPSKGFYSSENSIDTTESSINEDMTFKEQDLVCMADNMHRIDKDVDRCDRNHPYFSTHGQHLLKGSTNLRKLRNIMITWVWEHSTVGYVQGMCDLLAPLLVVLDSESLTHACFTRLMETMIANFPQITNSMDYNLSMMALLLQIIDRNLYDHMCPNDEVTSLYVSYRWFLLDFKRELCYADVFCVWETIWSARHVASNHFNLFLALSFLQYYRDIILDNDMEYTDIIKFFNEMAEKHQVQKLLYIARGLIESIRDIVHSV